MPRALVWGFLLLPLPLWAAGASPAAPVSGVNGAFLQKEGKQPIPGSLVVLYESGTGYLVDSTYTRDDGKFNIRPPLRKGSYHLVATKGDVSERVALTYDPATPGVYREILHKSQKSFWAKAWDSVVSLMKGFFGTIAGFFLGYSLKQWEERRSAAKIMDRRTTELRRLVQEANRELGDAMKSLQRPIVHSQYRKILADLLPQVEAIEAELIKGSIQDAAFELRRARGTDEYFDYLSRVRNIKNIADSQEEVEPKTAAERLEQLKELLGKLKTQPLTRARRPWWRRTGSTS